MAGTLDLTVRNLIGHTQRVQIEQSATVLDLKKLISTKFPNAPYYRSKLTSKMGQGSGTVLEDNSKPLSHYSSVTSGSVLFLLIEKPFQIYVQDPESKIFDIDVPACDPKMYTMTELRALVQSKCGRKLDNYQFQHNGKPLEESNHGRKLTFQDHGINKEDTVFLLKLGLDLDIVEPLVDICFMMDCTSSMSSWIESMKQNVTNVRDRLETQYKGCDLRVSFVRYTDYDVLPESSRTTWLNFTKSLPEFHNFVGPIKAQGGGDTPEDIMGALKITLSTLDWRASSAKVLIHIADAPCHGTQYHSTNDTYPNGDPGGITHDEMMQKVAQLEIQYWFGYIQQDSTDKMIDIFNDSLKQHSGQTLIIRQFNATDPKQLADAIHKSVTASVTANEAKKASSQVLGSAEVNWETLSVRQAVKTPTIGISSIQELQRGLAFGMPSISFPLKMATTPFADGEESMVYKGLDTRRNFLLTLKQLKAAANNFDNYTKMQEIQVIASVYARCFNTCRASRHPELDFLVVDIVDVNGTYYLTQEYVPGKFEKYNTNNGIVCPDPPHSDVMQAFSHFTFFKSEQSLLICDLEGVIRGNKVVLTDPAIHNRTFPKKYGATDGGFLGIRRFFASHECNSICREMGLEGTKA